MVAYLGPHEDPNDEEDVELEVVESREGFSTFAFVPTREDCGKYLKCVAIHENDDGEVLFDEFLATVDTVRIDNYENY